MPAGSPFSLPAPVSVLLPGLPAVSIPGSRSYPFLARPLGADSVQRHPGVGVGCQPRPVAGAMSPELSRRRRPQSISPDRKTANSVLDHKSRALPVQPAAATSPDSSHLPTFPRYSRRGQSLGVHPEAGPFCYSSTLWGRPCAGDRHRRRKNIRRPSRINGLPSACRTSWSELFLCVLVILPPPSTPASGSESLSFLLYFACQGEHALPVDAWDGQASH